MRCKFCIFAVFAALLGFAPVVADELADENGSPQEATLVVTDEGEYQRPNDVEEYITESSEPEETEDTGQPEEISQTANDDDVEAIVISITDLGWCDKSLDTQDPRKAELCDKLTEIQGLEDEINTTFENTETASDELAENTQDLEENYQNMKDKENSLENRMLGAAGIGTVGIGGMMAAQSLAEQNADKSAEQDMQAYLSTFSCRYGDKTARGGEMSLEIPGSNHLINLYQEYAELSQDLKTRKDALGISPGIESEIVIDKATTGLYDDVGTGIGSGAYASIARALRDPNGEDAKKWAEQKEASSKNLKIGATVAAAGAIAGIAGNYLINHDNKDKSAELLAKRQEIKSRFTEVSDQFVQECNVLIQQHKDAAALLTAEELADNQELQQYKKDVEAAKPIKSLSEIGSSLFCK